MFMYDVEVCLYNAAMVAKSVRVAGLTNDDIAKITSSYVLR